jgi:ferritin
MKFSEKLIEFLGVLYRHELHNQYVYYKISNYLDVLGFKKLADYYRDWANHEKDHSEKVLSFANDNNLHIDMTIPVNPIYVDLSSHPLTYFVQLTMDTENATTDLYNQYLELGEEENNPFVRRFSLDFILEQQEETGKAYDIYDSVMNIGDNKALLMLFNNTFGD